MWECRTESSAHEIREVLSCSITESLLAHNPSLVNKHREKRVRSYWPFAVYRVFLKDIFTDF